MGASAQVGAASTGPAMTSPDLEVQALKQLSGKDAPSILAQTIKSKAELQKARLRDGMALAKLLISLGKLVCDYFHQLFTLLLTQRHASADSAEN